MHSRIFTCADGYILGGAVYGDIRRAAVLAAGYGAAFGENAVVGARQRFKTCCLRGIAERNFCGAAGSYGAARGIYAVVARAGAVCGNGDCG